MRITSLFAFLFLVGCIAAAPMPVKQGKDSTAALEQLLIGEWIGKPSVGDIVFREDGTFAQKNYWPRESVFEGTWKVKWETLPPTLILTAKTSTDEKQIKRTIERQITRLDDQEFQFTADKEDAVSLKRKTK
jgi:hypothetical protein